MGTIQNSVNQITGTLMGAAVAGKHLKQQKQSNELAKQANEVAATKELESAKNEYMNTNEALLENDAKYQNEQELEKGLANMEDADTYLESKRDIAEENYNEASREKMERDFNYEMGIQKSKPSSKRLQKAMDAYESVQDEIMARENLKFDYDQATTRLTNALKNKITLGGNK